MLCLLVQNSTEPKVIGSLPDRQYKALSCGSDFSAAVTGQYYLNKILTFSVWEI